MPARLRWGRGSSRGRSSLGRPPLLVGAVRLVVHPGRRAGRPGREGQAAPLPRRRCRAGEGQAGLLLLRRRRVGVGLLDLRRRHRVGRRADVGLPDRLRLHRRLVEEEAPPVHRRRPRLLVVEEVLLEHRRRHRHLVEPKEAAGVVGRRPQARQQREEAVATVAR